MRIGILCHASCGGSARVATRLADGLARRGYRVHLISRAAPFGYDPGTGTGIRLHRLIEAPDDSLPVTHLHTCWSPREREAALDRLHELCRHEALELLHLHYALPFAFLAADLRQRLGPEAPPTVVTLHGSDVSVHGRDPTVAPRLARALLTLDRLTTVSRAYARLATDLFALPEPPEVIPNFIDTSRFNPDIAPRAPRPHRRPRIIHLSNFREIKDTPTMARAFVRLRERLDAKLWLVGDGPELPRVRAILERAGVMDSVRVWGLRRDVAPILARCDLMLVSSRAESFCLAALEAMACGLPVVATAVGGLPEVVRDGECGLLFPVGDHERAARLAHELLVDPPRLTRMRQSAARRARAFAPEKIIPRYEALYDTVREQRAVTERI